MTSNLEPSVRLSLKNQVAYLTLCRPDNGNALGLALAQEFLEAVRLTVGYNAQSSIRLLVIRAEGTHFCVGGDLHEFAQASDRSFHIKKVADTVHEAIILLQTLSLPVLSVIHGTIAGGGIGLALSADIILMACESKFRMAYTAVGLSPDCGVSWILPRRLGLARALDLTLTNRVVTGEQLQDWGLVSRVVSAGELQAEADSVIQSILAAPAEALAQSKSLTRAAMNRTFDEQIRVESENIARLAGSENGIEGIDAFIERRTPSFL